MLRANLKFTEDDKKLLTDATRKAVQGLIDIWEALNLIGAERGIDWEPENQSCAEIIEYLASCATTAEEINPDAIAKCFNRREDWQRL